MYSEDYLDRLLWRFCEAVDSDDLDGLEWLWHLGDGSRVLEWALIEQMDAIREEGLVAGSWRLTKAAGEKQQRRLKF